MMLLFLQPFFLSGLLDFIDSYCGGCDTEQPTFRGYLLSTGLFVVAVAQTLLIQQYYHKLLFTAVRTRIALVTAVYQKAFRLSNDSRQKSTIGEMVNLMSTDSHRLMEVALDLHIVWAGPLQIIVAIALLYRVLGPAVFAGIGVILLVIPTAALSSKKMDKFQRNQMKAKDSRIRLLNEILSGIKVIKLFAWENSFLKRVTAIRNEELSNLTKMFWTGCYDAFCWYATPFLVSATCFICYILSKALPPFRRFILLWFLTFPPLFTVENKPLTPEVAFVSLSLLNIMRLPMYFFPHMIVDLVQGRVALSRLSDFLTLEEIDEKNCERLPFDDDQEDQVDGLAAATVRPSINGESVAAQRVLVEVREGSFQWSKEAAQAVLSNISLEVREGELLAIVGAVGAGKSSLMSAILGDSVKVSGTVRVRGSVAYVAQQAWIVNATLQDNILFGLPLDQEFYTRVIEACALLPDLEILPAGDKTEIGERGINLSGGQKQRVSLARAIYSKANIYLLDDPLSAVDPHVGKHIFDKVIGPKGLMRQAARVFVTHAIQYLPKSDQIIVLKEGRVSEAGTFTTLMETKGEFSLLIEEFSSGVRREESTDQVSRRTESGGQHGEQKKKDQGEDKEEKEEQEEEQGEEEEEADGGLIEAEEAQVGRVKGTVYMAYLRAMGIAPFAVLIFLNVLGLVTNSGTNMWLSRWSSQASNDDLGLNLGIYMAFGLSYTLVSVLQSIVSLVICGIRAATKTHEAMLRNIFRAPMSFFDTTPQVPHFSLFSLSLFFYPLAARLICLSVRLGRIINRFSKDQNAVDEDLIWIVRYFTGNLFDVLTILVMITVTVYYFAIVIIPLCIIFIFIHAFFSTASRQLNRLDAICRSPLYAHFTETLNGVSTIRAYGQTARFARENEVRMDRSITPYFFSNVADRWRGTSSETLGAMVVLIVGLMAVLGFGTLDSAAVGLCVTYALSITQFLNWVLEDACDIEIHILSVERMREYASVKNEAPAEVPDSPSPPKWPSRGEVRFSNYSTKYREGLDLVLRDIDCTIRPKEKVGVVGRTGAGKSSLTLALFRIIEPEAGTILIDDVNIMTLGLRDLRSHLTIIPQDPVLFAGTLRENLDPFDEVSDNRIWAALGSVHLRDYVAGLSLKLEHRIAQGGENLSVGQRQLVCLGRALLRKSKVLVLDEATAAVDVETDDLIQKTIREEFRECTIITIAHRINTIMDSDRILVLDQGKIAEFDTPEALLGRPASLFYSLAKQSGLV